MIGAHRPVLRVDDRAFDDREQVALHAFARDVGTVHAFAAGDLVDLVEEDDPRLLDAAERLLRGGLHVDQPRRLFLREDLERLGDAHALRLRALRHQVLEHLAQRRLNLLHALRCHHLDHRTARRLRHLDLDRPLVEAAVVEQRAELVAGVGLVGARHRGLRRRREEEVEQSLLGLLAGADAHLLALLFAHHVDRELGEVADDRLDVAADVADLGELRRFDLDERRLRELGQPARDLGLPDAGRADHDDVLRRDLVAQRFRHLHAAPAVAERDRDRPLRGALADDVAVELGDDLARGERRRAHASSSIVSRSFV